MKVEQTQTTFRLSSNGLLGYLGGFLFLVVGIYLFFVQDIPTWIAVLFTVAGLIAVLFNSPIDSTFDKGSNKVTVVVKRLVGKKVTEYNIKDVKQILLAKFTSIRKGKVSRTSQIFMQLSDDTVALTQKSGITVLFFSLSGNEKAAKQLAQFLGVEYKTGKNLNLKL